MQENKETNDTSNTSNDTEIVPSSSMDETTSTPVTETPVTESISLVAEEPASEQEPAVVTVPDTATTVPITTGSDVKKQLLTQYGIATLVIVIIGVGLAYALEQQGRINTGVFDQVTELVNPAPAVAIVNGQKITKAEYDKNLAQLQTAAAAQGADLTDESIQAEIKTQAIDILINTELLRQTAYAEGALVTDEQIEARYQEILTSIGGQEALDAKMIELNITEEALRKDIEGEILLKEHLSKAVDLSTITITEQELTDAYAQISGTAAAGVTIPPLEEIKEQLEAQLKINKEQELVNAYIMKLRESAEIEVLI